MATISNGESGSSVRTKLNEIINKVEGVTSINNNISVTGTVTADGLTVDGLVKSDTASNGFRVLKGSSSYYGELSVDYIGNDVFTYVDSIAGASYNGSVKIRTANNGGSVADRVRVSSAGVSFYEDTGTTPKFFWDASAESLGIGTSSPYAALTTVNSGALTLDSNDGNHNGFGLFITPSTISINTVNSAIGFGSDGSGRKYAAIGMQTYGDVDQTGLNFYVQSAASGSSAVLTEAMRIDASGNLLVGKTSAAFGTQGIALRPVDGVSFTRSSGSVLDLNRLSTNGEIIGFYKDGAPVGSIGTASGYMYAGSGNTYLYYDDTNNIIRPSNSVGAARDNIVGLGNASNRFTNLYLSGGVYLGGTGAANLLDDYETGTWTPVPADAASAGNTGTSTSATGSYTKVGNLVQVNCVLANVNTTGLTSGNAFYIQGLPFSSGDITGATAYYLTGGVLPSAVSSNGNLQAYVQDGGNSAVVLYDIDGAILVSDLTSGSADFYFSLTYQTS